ncbi:RING finger protein 17-like isoform X2 [Actinia tenebrosa]|uniref:RING finger protein 17-like isoform X2 n=1 Tax=Actinia tenebrosa TaxID=6105 RepID=A0A6P8HVB4_ACTTE|nr:RING finger protein 17-like isoform X2 [Actinia tenebrosa]
MQRTPTCKNCCRNFCFQGFYKNKPPNIPLLLECGHTFCKGCITKLARLHKTQVICPECNYPTVLVKEGEAGVAELQVNVYTMGIMATNSYRKALLERTTAKKADFKLTSKTGMQQAVALIARQRQLQVLKCEECFSATATSRCIKCECVFCTKCFEKVHSSSHTLQKHRPLPLLETSADANSFGCTLHDNRPFEFFDKDDKQPVCAHCVVVGDRQTHDIVPIDHMTNEIKEQLQQSLNDGKSILMHLEHSQKKINDALAHSKSDKMQLINEIREHFQFLSANLQVRENVLVKEVESSQSAGESLELSVTEDIKKTRNLIMELEMTLEEPSKLINRAKGFMTELEKLREKPCFAVKTTNPDGDESRFSYNDDYLDSIRVHGEIKQAESIGLELKKLSEVSEEELNQQSDEEETESVMSEDSSVLDDIDNNNDVRRSLAARKLLNIPYRHELAQVTHIRDPSYFMVQRLADMEQLNVMMNAINKYCEASDASDLVLEANIGDMVCAQFTVDNHWYRARVMSMNAPSHHNVLPTVENGLTIQVMYIDYGNLEWIPMIRLRTMPKKFLQVPDMAVCCSLVDVVPPFQQNQWPPKAIKAFGSLTGDKPLLMTALRRGLNGTLHVDLKSPDDDEPTHDDDRPASVRDALVFLEVAKFKSPASEPSVQVMQQSFPMRSFKDPSALEEGQTVPVLISHVTGPDEIYLQKLDEDEVSQLLFTMQEMERLYNERTKRKDLDILWPYKGLVCSARFTEDKSWYRALVVGVNSDETVDVTYVDYGNAETLPFSEIRKLPDSLLGLPRQAYPACLADVKPCEESEDWNEQVQDFVCGLLLNKQFDANIIGTSGGKASIVLRDATSQKDVSVNDLLVQCHRAVPSGLGVVKSFEEDEEAKKPSEEEKNSANEEGKVTVEKEEKQSAVEETQAEDKLDIKTTESIEKTDEHRNEGIETHPQEEMAVIMENQGKEKTIPSTNKPPMSPPERLLAQYPPAIPPVDRQFQASVTYVGLDGSIFVQELKEDDRTLINMMEKLNIRYNSHDQDPSDTPTSIKDLFIGQPCCARFSDDGMWYRALVTKVIVPNKVEVNYIDFGNSEIVPLSELRLEVLDIDVPKQCLQLVLYGVRPANSQGRWSGEAISFLSEMIVGKDCSAIIEGAKIPGMPMEVRLCFPDGMNVADALIAKGLVTSTSGVVGPAPDVQSFPAGMSKATRSKSRGKKNPPVSRVENKLQAMLISAREADNILPQTQLPEVGMPFDVTVTHVEHPGSFFIQRSPDFDLEDVYDTDPTLLDVEEELEKLEEMAISINQPEYFKKYEPLAHAKKGLLCCGRYTEDDMWYRGQVLAVQSDKPLRALVRYFDYGNSEVLTGDRMRGFPSELLDLPIQATHCCLGDVTLPKKTADSSKEGSGWHPEAKEQMIELVAGKRLTAKIVAYSSPISVILYDHVPSEDGEPLDISIGETLAKKGLLLASREDYDVLSGDLSSEGAPSEESSDVEIEDDEVNEETSDNGTPVDWATKVEKELDFGETRELTRELINPDAQTTKPQSENLLEKLLSSRVGFAPVGKSTPLLTPQEFSVSPTKSLVTSDPVARGQDEATADITGQRSVQDSEPQKSQTVKNKDEEEKEEEKELNSGVPETLV